MQKVPFNAEVEMQYTKSYKALRMKDSGLEKLADVKALNTPISIRENYLRMVKDRSQLWMPGFSDTFSLNLVDIPDNVARGMVNEAVPFDVDSESGGPDWFGVNWIYMPSASGSMVAPGNPKVLDLEHWEDYVTIPDPNKIDWEAIAERTKPLFDGERPVTFTQYTGLFERLISFVDFEDAALAMIDEEEQEHVHRLFDKLADFYIELIRLAKKHLPIDIYLLHDDWGSQRAPFFSLAACREMLVPYMKRIGEAVHELGLVFSSHSCGKNEMLLPAYIESGFDVWCPQPMNDAKKLLDESEGKLVIGAFAPEMLAGTSDEAIIKAADEYFEKFGSYKNAILNIRGGAEEVEKFRNRVYTLTRESYNK